jgi:hypothetical protein
MPPLTRDDVGIFLASLESAELTTEPELKQTQDGFAYYEAMAELSFRRPLRVQIVPLCDGWDVPYHRGDRVRVLHNHGVGIVLGMYASATDHGGHTHIGGRAGRDLRLGSGSGEWEALALHARMAAELQSLKAQVDALASFVEGMTAVIAATAATIGPIGVGAEAAVSGATIEGGITGGDAAAGAKGRKA